MSNNVDKINIIEAVENGRINYINDKIRKPTPRYVNRISDLGHPCQRYLYHARVDWSQAKQIDPYLFGIFETGSVLEEFIRRNFNDYGRYGDAGFRIVGDQSPTIDKFLSEKNIQGTSDGVLQIQSDQNQWQNLGAIDIKTMHPNIFASINSYEDLDKYLWTEKYKSQVMLYSFAANLDRCYLLLCNKANLHDIKLIEFNLDYNHVEDLLIKAQQVNDAVEKKQPPSKINRPDVCLRCPFEAVCMPAIKIGEGFDVIEDTELTELIDRKNQLSDYKKEYDAVDRRLKQRLVKGKNILCGNYYIQWSATTRKEYVVPESTFYRMKIVCTDAESDFD